MEFVAGGFALSLIAVLLRLRYGTRRIALNYKYYSLLCLSILGSILAFIGFLQLSRTPINQNVEYAQILSILSLLAAGIITGYFTFTYEQAASDELLFPTAYSTCFALLFYFVFSLISFYMGKSKHVHSTEAANIVVPIIMWVILLANAFRDFWDYRKGPTKSLPVYLAAPEITQPGQTPPAESEAIDKV
ncbi:MAG TPA: hypothetical protein VJU86_22005 [Pyrinomonadaceae bacterium]|nr:hypothetical protein [Pyrinomonadaceae bacterium]